MKKINLVFAFLLLVAGVYAQSVTSDPIKFKTGRSAGNSTESKMKNAPKEILINRFRIFYELVYVDAETAQAGVNRGAASASLTVGFEGVDDKLLIGNTNRVFEEFKTQLGAAGYKIVNNEDAKDVKAYKGWTMVKGGQINSAQVQGMAMVSPEGFNYFVKEVLPSGKEKTSFFDPSAFVSNQMGKIPVVNVDIYVLFMTDSESGASKLATKAVGGVAKVVASPYLRVSAEGTKSSFNSMGNAVIFTPMEDDIVIGGVFEDQKFKASVAARTNTVYENVIYRSVLSEDVKITDLQMAKCDIEAYKKGVYMATSKYIKESTQLFLDFANGKK